MRENSSLRLERVSMSTFQGLIQSSFINVLPDQSLEANMPRWCYDFRGIEFALEKMKKKEVAQVRAVCSNLSIQTTAPASREQSQHFPHPIIDLHSLSKYLLTMYETGENTLARAFCQLQYFLSWNFNFLQITLKPAYGFGTAGCSQLVPEAFIIFAQFFHLQLSLNIKRESRETPRWSTSWRWSSLRRLKRVGRCWKVFNSETETTAIDFNFQFHLLFSWTQSRSWSRRAFSRRRAQSISRQVFSELPIMLFTITIF